MLPIPAFNPGDTVTYPNGNGVINVGAADAGSKMLLYNESPFNINIDFLNGNQSILHAWEARYWTLDGDTRQVEWDINSTLNVTSSPISLVIGELYGAREKLEGTYPMGLIRQTNVGNPGGIVSSASTIINDGNALLQIIEATLSGHASSDVIVNNDGSYTLKGAGLLAAVGVLTHILGNLTVDGTTTHTGATTQTGVLTAPAANVLGAIGILTHILGTLTVDQASTLSGVVTAPAANLFGALNVLTHILGTLTVDQTSTFTGAVTANNLSNTILLGTGINIQQTGLGVNVGGDTLGISQAGARYDIHVKTPGGAASGSIGWLESEGTQVFKWAIGGPSLVAGTLGLLTGTIARLAGVLNTTCGSGTVITHGLGATPTKLTATPNIVQAGSATVGIGSIGATTFTATVGAGSAISWLAIA